MRRLLFSVAGLTFLCSFSACTRKHSFELADVSKTNRVTLVSRHGDLVSGVLVRVRGELQGAALVFVSGSATQAIGGSVDWKVNQALQTSNCVFSYLPQQVTGGRLTVSYFFH
jgi:hypothetical protein